MALTYANVVKIYRGPVSFVYAEATFSASYPSGGETLNATDIGLTTINMVIPSAERGYDVAYSATNATSGKLAIYASSDPSTNSAVAAPLGASVGRAFSTVSVQVLVIGLG